MIKKYLKKLIREEISSPYVGTVLVGYYSDYIYRVVPIHIAKSTEFKWLEFTKEDILEWHDNYIKLRHPFDAAHFHKEENIVFYSDIYEPLKKRIENKIRNKGKNNE